MRLEKTKHKCNEKDGKCYGIFMIHEDVMQ